MMPLDKRLVAGVLLSCGACQSYLPVTVAPATAGQNVRVTLTTSGITAAHGAVGTGVGQLEGRLQNVTDSTIAISVTEVSRAAGIDEDWNGESVTLPRADVALVEQRRTAVARSLMAAGVIVGGVALIANAILGGQQSGTVGGPVQTPVK
jgi:hypothetical protein